MNRCYNNKRELKKWRFPIPLIQNNPGNVYYIYEYDFYYSYSGIFEQYD